MKQARWLTDSVVLGNQFHYRTKNPLIHNAINLGAMFLLLSGIVAVLHASTWVPTLIYLPVAAFCLAWMFFSLIILVIHEASHKMFVVRTDRQDALFWNRFFGWMVSIPFGINYLRHWEEGHHIHHIHPLEPDDPHQENIHSGKTFLRIFFMMLVIPGYVFLWNPSRRYDTQRWVPLANAAFWAVAVGLMLTFWNWKGPVAVLWGFGVLGAINQIKGSLEHGGDVGQEANRNLRSRTSLFALRWLLLPFNISLHFEHHLNYCVPWYELPAYQRAMRVVIPSSLQPLIFNSRLWDQLMGRLGTYQGPQRELLEMEG